MNRFVTCLAILGMLGLAACSGDSPSAPPVPTVVPDTWQITDLTVSNSNPTINTWTYVEATVTKNGSPAPDGTSVTFQITPDINAIAGTKSRAVVASKDGKASIGIIAEEQGTYSIQVTAGNATRSIQVNYVNPSTSVRIFIPLVPDRGNVLGEEQVIITGTAISLPVEVFFTIQETGESYAALVESVEESDPPSTAGTITIRTPRIVGSLDTEDNLLADVTVRVGIGTDAPSADTATGAFTFLPKDAGGGQPTPAAETLFEPVLYVVNPDSGPKAGGNTVTIVGRNFRSIVTDENGDVVNMPERVESVQFGNREADVVGVSPDGMQVQVVVPRLQTLPLENPQAVDVTVTTNIPLDSSNGPFTKTLNQAYVYMPDEPTPDIASVTPIAGPINGGTVVTIYGSGFQVPVEVRFGNLAATEVEVIDDPTLADNDVITCVTPDYSQQNVETPVAVDVRVTNLQTGKSNTLSGAFTYGQQLYVTGNSPFEGRPGDLVAIYGAGFDRPLEVFFAGNEKLEVVSVSGSEILARFPADMEVTCSERNGSFTVSLLESEREAEGGSFTLLGNNPTIVDVRTQDGDVFVGELGGESATIFGVNFTNDVLVEINNVSLVTANVVPQSSSEIRILALPSADDIGLTFQTESCITGGGQQGFRQAPTPVSVGVVNFPGQCGNVLQGALIYEPADTTCVVAPSMSVAVPSFPATDAQAVPPVPAGQTLTISNTGAGTLNISSLNLGGRFFFDANCSQITAGAISIAPFASDSSLSIYFCPDQDTGAFFQGQLNITSNNPGSPNSYNLSGEELSPVMVVNPTTLTFVAPYPNQQQFTVENTGNADLNYTVTGVAAPFSIVSGGSGLVSAGGNATVTISASAAGNGSLTVDATEPDATDQTVTLTAP